MLIRSFSLIKSMNPDGAHVGGIIGFLRSLGYVNRILDPSRVIIVWDGKGGSGNRKNINPDPNIVDKYKDIYKKYIVLHNNVKDIDRKLACV